MKKRRLMTLPIAIIVIMLCAQITVERVFSQPQQRDTISRSPSVKADGQSDRSYDIAQKLEFVEYRLDTAEYVNDFETLPGRI